jgi:hypothetical protein
MRFTIHTRLLVAQQQQQQHVTHHHHHSSSNNGVVQLLNTPIISMDTFSDLEDRDGLVCIDCGDEVRILIPMITHPLWRAVRMRTQRRYQRRQQQPGQEQQQQHHHRSSTITPRLSSSVIEACLLRRRVSSWLHFQSNTHHRVQYGHGQYYTEEDELAAVVEGVEEGSNNNTLLHKIISCGAWGFVVLAMIYPYLLIIFITLSQTVLFQHSYQRSTDTTTLMQSSLPFASFYQTAVLFAASAVAVVWSSNVNSWRTRRIRRE